MVEDVWSKQFYKALEAVGNLTEQERLKLGNMLIALSDVKETKIILRSSNNDDAILQEQMRILGIRRKIGGGHCSPEEKVPDFIPSPPKPPETTKISCDRLLPKKP